MHLTGYACRYLLLDLVWLLLSLNCDERCLAGASAAATMVITYLDVRPALDVVQHPPRRDRVQVPQVDRTQVKGVGVD